MDFQETQQPVRVRSHNVLLGAPPLKTEFDRYPQPRGETRSSIFAERTGQGEPSAAKPCARQAESSSPTGAPIRLVGLEDSAHPTACGQASCEIARADFRRQRLHFHEPLTKLEHLATKGALRSREVETNRGGAGSPASVKR